jgi:Tol biopolymer transport system component
MVTRMGRASRVRWMSRAALFGLLLAVSLAGSGNAGATYPGANGPLVFSAVDETTRTVQTFRVAADGTGLTQLTSTTGLVWNECPSVSADGRTVYFDSQDRSTTNPSKIYRMNIDGTGRTLSDSRGPTPHACPSVGPGGRMITALQFPRQGGTQIIRMNTNGSGVRVIARGPARVNNFSPTYSPNGRRILFNRVTYTKHNVLTRSDLLVTRGTGQPMNLTANDANQFTSPSWSPDGQSILAVRGRTGNVIVRMDAEGLNMRVLATGTGGAWFSSPVYSPDGTKIAYMQCDGDCGDPMLSGQGSLWVMNADGSNQTPILVQDDDMQPFFQVNWAVPAS